MAINLKVHSLAETVGYITGDLLPLCNVHPWLGDNERLTAEDDKVTCENCWRIILAELRRNVQAKLKERG